MNGLNMNGCLTQFLNRSSSQDDAVLGTFKSAAGGLL